MRPEIRPRDEPSVESPSAPHPRIDVTCTAHSLTSPCCDFHSSLARCMCASSVTPGRWGGVPSSGERSRGDGRGLARRTGVRRDFCGRLAAPLGPAVRSHIASDASELRALACVLEIRCAVSSRETPGGAPCILIPEEGSVAQVWRDVAAAVRVGRRPQRQERRAAELRLVPRGLEPHRNSSPGAACRTASLSLLQRTELHGTIRGSCCRLVCGDSRVRVVPDLTLVSFLKNSSPFSAPGHPLRDCSRCPKGWECGSVRLCGPRAPTGADWRSLTTRHPT